MIFLVLCLFCCLVQAMDDDSSFSYDFDLGATLAQWIASMPSPVHEPATESTTCDTQESEEEPSTPYAIPFCQSPSYDERPYDEADDDSISGSFSPLPPEQPSAPHSNTHTPDTHMNINFLLAAGTAAPAPEENTDSHARHKRTAPDSAKYYTQCHLCPQIYKSLTTQCISKLKTHLYLKHAYAGSEPSLHDPTQYYRLHAQCPSCPWTATKEYADLGNDKYSLHTRLKQHLEDVHGKHAPEWYAHVSQTPLPLQHTATAERNS